MMTSNHHRPPETGMESSPPETSDEPTTLSVAVDMRELAGMRRWVTSEMGAALDGEAGSLYLVAVTEAVTNAIEAQQGLGVDAPVVVTIDRPAGVVIVEDRGGGLPASLARETAVPENAPGPEARRGRGLMIMRSICPGLRVVGAGNGTRIELPFPQ